jgi:predicted lipoprotein with Yx(FWY)xxD motif
MLRTKKRIGVSLGLLMLLALVPLASAQGVTVQVADHPELGKILTDGQGMTLYLFTPDDENVSNCYDQCAVNWPPLLVEEGQEPAAGAGLTGELGITERTDGGRQVTYNGMPLYYWIQDNNPGDATGQDVGDVWYVVHPDISTMTVDSPVVTVMEHPSLGPILTNQGMTLYLFTTDEEGVTNCYDQCAVNWPPLLVGDGAPVAGTGVTGALSVIDRTDGGRQVAYNDVPLYFWIRDVRPGDATGQGVGDVWFVLSAETTAAALTDTAAQAQPEAQATAETPPTLPQTGGGMPSWAILLLVVGGAALLATGLGLALAQRAR